MFFHAVFKHAATTYTLSCFDRIQSDSWQTAGSAALSELQVLMKTYVKEGSRKNRASLKVTCLALAKWDVACKKKIQFEKRCALNPCDPVDT